jgi:hypothetical protein
MKRNYNFLRISNAATLKNESFFENGSSSSFTKTKWFFSALVLFCLLFTGLNASAQVTKTVGGTGGADFTTLKAAFDAINAGTIGNAGGAITLNVISNTTETAPCVLNSTGAGAASYTSVSIQPTVDGVTISGATATGRGLVELNGADNVTIDGDNANSGGTNRNLTFTNTAANTVTHTSVIRIAVATSVITSANNNIIRNCIINGSATGRNISTATSTTGTENASYGIYVSGGASTVSATTAPTAISSTSTVAGSGATWTGLTISNNQVTSCARGIYVGGSATTVCPSLTVTNNVVGSATAGNTTTVYSMGITLQGYTAATVSGNTIQNMESFLGTAIRGLDLGSISATGTNAIVERNLVNVVNNRSTSTFGSYGINITAGNGNTIRNNMVQGITGDITGGTAFSSANGIYGIRINAGTGHLVYHNSVNLYGLRSGTANSNMLGAAFGITVATATGCDVRNNIFSNTMTGGTTLIAYVSIYLPNGLTSAFNLTLNNNAYYTGSTAGVHGICHGGFIYTGTVSTAGTGLYTVANFNPAVTTGVTNLRNYTSALLVANTNNDNASFGSTAAAPYTSSSNLALNLASGQLVNVEQKGVAGLFGFDIAGDVRPNLGTTFPDMGADEVAVATCSVASGGAIATTSANRCFGFTATIASTGATTGTGISYQWKVASSSGGALSNVTGGSGATTTSYTTDAALAPGIYYFKLETTCSFGPLTGLSNEFTLTVNALPTVTVTPNTGGICTPGGAAITLLASGATTYSWSPATGLSATTGASVIANPTATTTYTVTGTDANGCVNTATAVITVSAKPDAVTITPATPTICSGAIQMLTAAGGGSAGTSATIGAGTGFTTATDEQTAFCNRRLNYVGQTIYTAAELSAAGVTPGNITSLAYNISSNGDATTNANFTVKIGHVGATAIFPSTAFFDNTAYTSVYGPATYTHSSPGFQVITFSTPFVWNGIDNICIDVRHDGIDSINNAQTQFSTTAGNASLYGYNTPAVGTLSTSKLNIRFGYSNPATSIVWAPTTGLFTDAGATTAYTGSPSTTVVYAQLGVTQAYTVTSTNAAGCQTVGTVTVTVSSGAAITTNPAATAKCAGETATFNVVATGAALTYQWRKGGSPLVNGGTISGADTATLTITNVIAADADTYDVIVSSSCGSPVTSLGAVLTVNPLPAVVIASGAGTFCTSTTITANNGGDGTMYFQGTTSGGTSTATASASQVVSASGTYYFRAQSAAGCWGPEGSVAVVIETPPGITGTPASICQGASGTIAAVAANNCISYVNSGTTLSGTFTAGDPQANRPATSILNSATCSFSTILRGYQTQEFQVSVTGTYTFDMTSTDDGMAYITSGAFTPGSCATGTWLRGDDDNGPGNDPQLLMTLTAGTVYTLYSTTWSSTAGNSTAAYSWTITPPAGGQLMLPVAGAIQWYTAASGGSPIGSGSPFNPVGVAGSGLADTNTAGTTTYYAACSSSSSCRTAVNFVINTNVTYYADVDGDGFGGAAIVSCTGQPANTVTTGGDCDDNQILYADLDGDGFGSTTQAACGVTNNTDCNDAVTFYTDLDNDGFGVLPKLACGTITNNTDCDDTTVRYADVDGDTFGSITVKVACGGVTNNTDCNDNQIQYLDADNDGYGVPTQVACGVANSTDCNDAVAAIHPGAVDVCLDGIDNDCNGNIDNVGLPGGCVPVLTTLPGATCGSTISNLAVTITATYVVGAQGYRFRVKNLNTSAIQIVDRPVNSFALSNLPGITLGTPYEIDVALKFAGVWQPFYGAACTVNTPSPLCNIGAQCGTTLTSMTQFVYCTYVPSITGYRFRITKLSDSSVQILDSGLNRFFFNQLPNKSFNSIYSVEVALKNTDGTYLPYNTGCNISTPNFPTSEVRTSQCDYIALSNTESIVATIVSGATDYRFIMFNTALGYSYSIDRSVNTFNLNMFPGLTAGTTYSVQVAVKIGGVFGPYGKICNLTTPGGARVVETKPTNEFVAIAYPNPFANDFKLDVKTTAESTVNVRVYDMLGKLIESKNVEVSEIENLEIGANYTSGVYNVIVSQEANTQTVRVIKR